MVPASLFSVFSASKYHPHRTRVFTPSTTQVGFTDVCIHSFAYRYLNWIRRDKESKKGIADEFNQKEAELRNNPEFEQIFEDDQEALQIFRKTGDLGAFVVEDEDGSVESVEEHSASDLAERPSTTSKRQRLSMGSSISSIRSKMSAQGSLSPLREEDEEEGDSPSPMKRRRISQASGNFSVSMAGQAQEAIDEETRDSSDSE